MKIGIVTVYNAYNCGSFLQAFALYSTLKKDNDVYFVRNSHFSKRNKLYYIVLQSIKYFLKGNLKKSKFILRKYITFKKCRLQLPIKKLYLDTDLLIYGSDTIWNIQDPYFMNEWKKYWGFEVKQKKITYAVSTGGTPEYLISENSELKKCLSEFSEVSVRDKHTYNIVKNILHDDKRLKQVIDPTLLLNIQQYNNIAKKCTEDNFILVYIFSDIQKSCISQIKKFAQENSKKIIAFGEDFPADKNIPFDPFIMLGYYKKADYVFTNTFHGTVFSIIYNKEFASFGKNKTKVAQLLEEFKLSHRNIDCTNNLNDVMSSNIDYTQINQMIDEKRKISLDYLDKHLSEA